MKSTNKILIFLIVIFLLGAVLYDVMNPTYMGPDTLPDPVQGDVISETIEYVDKNGEVVEITFLATYELDAGIKGVKNYVTDGASDVSPKDVILAWGQLNQPEIDDTINYRQSNRWYYYRYSDETPLSRDYIASHSANTHLIPQDESVLKVLKKIRENDYVHLEGYLAVVHFEEGDWGSSTTRDDIGNGACEIFYVTEAIIY